MPIRVATAFIEPDGGGMNITAKIFASLWYICLLPDTKERLSRQISRKRVPWYAPSRIFGILVSAANLVTMPASWALLIAGKRNAARLASLGVLANPPTVTLSLLLINEISTSLLKKSGGLVCSTGSLIAKPFTWITSINKSSEPDAAPAVATSATDDPTVPAETDSGIDDPTIPADPAPSSGPSEPSEPSKPSEPSEPAPSATTDS